MSRNFNALNAQFLQPQLFDFPAETANNGFGNQAPLPPTIVAANIVWFNYGASSTNPNIAVSVNSINSGSQRQLLDRIRSIRIDNTGNNVPVYVYFFDTGFTVACPPNSIVTENVKTSLFQATVVGEGFTSFVSPVNSATTVYFSNYNVFPFVNTEIAQNVGLWLASSTITRGNSILQQNYNAPALGDQYIEKDTFMTAASGTTMTVFNFGTGFIYCTQLLVQCVGAVGNVPCQGQLIFESTGPSGQFFGPTIALTATTPVPPGSMPLADIRGNFKLNGAELWRTRWLLNSGTFSSGIIGLSVAYTTNPN